MNRWAISDRPLRRLDLRHDRMKNETQKRSSGFDSTEINTRRSEKCLTIKKSHRHRHRRRQIMIVLVTITGVKIRRPHGRIGLCSEMTIR